MNVLLINILKMNEKPLWIEKIPLSKINYSFRNDNEAYKLQIKQSNPLAIHSTKLGETTNQLLPIIKHSKSTVNINFNHDSNSFWTTTNHLSDTIKYKQIEIKDKKNNDHYTNIPEPTKRLMRSQEKNNSEWLNKSTGIITMKWIPSTKKKESNKKTINKNQIYDEIKHIEKFCQRRLKYKVLPLINRKIILFHKINRDYLLREKINSSQLDLHIMGQKSIF